MTNLINITIAPPVYFFHEIFSWKRMGRAYYIVLYTLGEISAHIHSSSFFDYWPHMVMIHPNFHLNFTKLCSSWYIEYAHVVCRRKIEWIFYSSTQFSSKTPTFIRITKHIYLVCMYLCTYMSWVWIERKFLLIHTNKIWSFSNMGSYLGNPLLKKYFK